MKVIIADDSNLIRERLQNLLRNFSQIELVGSFNNGTEALEALRKTNPDLAILDIRMPGLNGLEVLTAIRRENKSMKVIIFTMFPTDYYKQIALKAGADYFLSKVDEFDQVEVLLEKMLSLEAKKVA